MQVINTLDYTPNSDKRLVVALGNFDGVHLGHQHIIAEMVKYAEWTGTVPAVFLFHPHPMRVLNQEMAPKLLLDLDQKLQLIESLGVEIALVVPFELRLSTLTPQQFVEQILVKQLHVAGVFVGFNYRFGYGAAGTPEMLSELGINNHFLVNIMPPIIHNGTLVSSTQVRMAINSGNIPEAKKMLGYWPKLKGVVVTGDQRGRTLGFPTANVKVSDELIVPCRGVYAGMARLEGESYSSVLNIGYRPTFSKNHERLVEVHLLGYDGVAYGQTIELQLYQKLREEKKFEIVPDLVRQIRLDIQATNQICSRVSAKVVANPEGLCQ